METITRNVKDIGSDDRRALEHVIGRQLAENQRIVISVTEFDVKAASPITADGTLPGWCNVFEDLSDEEVADIEKIALTRAVLPITESILDQTADLWVAARRAKLRPDEKPAADGKS